MLTSITSEERHTHSEVVSPSFLSQTLGYRWLGHRLGIKEESLLKILNVLQTARHLGNQPVKPCIWSGIPWVLRNPTHLAGLDGFKATRQSTTYTNPTLQCGNGQKFSGSRQERAGVGFKKQSRVLPASLLHIGVKKMNLYVSLLLMATLSLHHIPQCIIPSCQHLLPTPRTQNKPANLINKHLYKSHMKIRSPLIWTIIMRLHVRNG